MDMNNAPLDLQDLLDEVGSKTQVTSDVPTETTAATQPHRLSPFLHRIPVTLTLEAGSARITLQELSELTPNSVIALDTLVGEPLSIKVNGTAIGKGEVVVSGETYGLKVLELSPYLPSLNA